MTITSNINQTKSTDGYSKVIAIINETNLEMLRLEAQTQINEKNVAQNKNKFKSSDSDFDSYWYTQTKLHIYKYLSLLVKHKKIAFKKISKPLIGRAFARFHILFDAYKEIHGLSANYSDIENPSREVLDKWTNDFISFIDKHTDALTLQLIKTS